MSNLSVLNAEAARYRALAHQLKESFTEIDDETLADTLEGLSDLPDVLQAIVRSCLLDEALAEGLRGRMSDLKDRLERFVQRSAQKREAVLISMTNAGLHKLMAEDFTISVKQSPAKVEVTDEMKIPPAYLIAQPYKVDRAGLLGALKRGELFDGAMLLDGQLHLQVRTK